MIQLFYGDVTPGLHTSCSLWDTPVIQLFYDDAVRLYK